ncbi:MULTISPECIES: carbohydrate ABC transporter permease [unclassified Oceanispirochaeta]|uniref:carbohydrate ABC transporter permease n=1 Tax=unclassified Oceanispirochaeta TaxID=2635722 RepID=UPI0018F6C786|nr:MULTISPECIES: carbohydrate ABC transporter permease [unclassified Oceanispirochaeta]
MSLLMNNSGKVKTDFSTVIFKIISVIVISLFSVVCLYPFIIMVTGSLTAEHTIVKYGYRLLPLEWSTESYKLVLQNPMIIGGSYMVTIVLTAVGTIIGLFITSMTGYALVRKDFAYRNHISFYIYFTTLFSAGIVPFYILMVNTFQLKDNYLAVLLPLLLSPWLVILMKNFNRSIPESITESAKMDGAGDFTIFLKLIMPMSKPAMASIGLFTALAYWNDWFYSMLFLSPNVKYRPLQLILYNLVAQADFMKTSAAMMGIPPQDIPSESLKLAAAVVATGPIVLVYPFIQKYFIKGITIGAVKG